MIVYPAAKSKHAVWFRALQSAGVPLQASWLTWPFNENGESPTQDDWAAHSAACLKEATAADVVLLVAFDGESHFGALLEAGAALAAGKRVFLVSPHAWDFLRHHPCCRSFDSVADAVQAIMAAAAGERARREMQVAA
jgi:hypothetical protein